MWLADSCAWQDNDPYSKSLSNKNDPLWRIPYNNQHFQLSNFLPPFSLITTQWLTFRKSFWEERALCGVPEHRGVQTTRGVGASATFPAECRWVPPPGLIQHGRFPKQSFLCIVETCWNTVPKQSFWAGSTMVYRFSGRFNEPFR